MATAAENKEYARQWNDYIDGITGLAWCPLKEHSDKVLEIKKELKDLVSAIVLSRKS